MAGPYIRAHLCDADNPGRVLRISSDGNVYLNSGGPSATEMLGPYSKVHIVDPINPDYFLKINPDGSVNAIGGSGGGGGAVDSVNGQTGVVVLDAADVGAATELYVDTAIAAISGFVDGGSASAVYAPNNRNINGGGA